MPHPDPLYTLAAGQEGHFTTPQAEASGYSRQLLRHHVLGGKFLRVQRGIYRFVQFPAGTHEHLVVAWLWSEQKGVLSHQTALLCFAGLQHSQRLFAFGNIFVGYDDAAAGIA